MHYRLMFLISLCLFNTICQAAGIQVGRTRVIYNEDKKEIALPLINKDKESPWLIQSWVDTGDGKTRGPFIITPPLFRLDPQKEQSLRITWNGTMLPNDRETLFFLNVRTIPAVAKDNEEKNVLHLIYKMRLKLFWRPKGLAGTPGKNCENLQFQRDGVRLNIVNNGSFYSVFDSIHIGSKTLTSVEWIAPKSQLSVNLPVGIGTGKITWRCITDYGNASGLFAQPGEG